MESFVEILILGMENLIRFVIIIVFVFIPTFLFLDFVFFLFQFIVLFVGLFVVVLLSREVDDSTEPLSSEH